MRARDGYARGATPATPLPESSSAGLAMLLWGRRGAAALGMPVLKPQLC